MTKSGVLENRHRIERDFHDLKAREVTSDFYNYGALHAADEFLINSLGNLRDRHIFEIGCGDGSTTVRFAEAGALVASIDISGEMVELTRKKAQEHNVSNRVKTFHTSVEDFNFPSDSFDVVYGHSILHHLNLEIAGPKIASMLRKGGVAAFLEPLDYNPILSLFRKITPHRRTPTERPLRREQIQALASEFSSWKQQEFYFVSLIAFVWYYVIRNQALFRWTLRTLLPLDQFLFRFFPFTRKYAWVTVLHMYK